MNPSATAAAGVGFGEDKGSVQYVALSDIKSGKVKLPPGTNVSGIPVSNNQKIEEKSPDLPYKGFDPNKIV